MNDEGKLDGHKLREWIVTAHALARELGREEIGDNHIGQLLAHSPIGSHKIWPYEAVREALEGLGTDRMAVGMIIGRYNARGAVWRRPGGDQERTHAERTGAQL